MAITKRLVKGSALTHTELDSNFTDLDGRVTTLESTPGSDSQTLTLAGDDLTITGGNTVSLSTLSTEVVDDTSPQLGGNLDLNGNQITGSGGSVIKEELNALSLVGGSNGIVMRTTTDAGITIGDQAGNVVLGNSANSVEFVNGVGVDFTNTNIDFTSATITGLSIVQGIDDLSDVDTSTTPPGVGQVLKWDGSEWAPAADSAGSSLGADAITAGMIAENVVTTREIAANTVAVGDLATNISIDFLSDVDTTTVTPTAGQVLKWDGAQWEPANDSSGSGGAPLAFVGISVDGQTQVLADGNADTLTFEAGAGMTITTDSSTDKIIFASTGGATTWATLGDKNNANGPSIIALGTLAGETSQGTQSIAIGESAGKTSQGNTAVAIGESAGKTSQGLSAVAIGTGAGTTNQGGAAIAIGNGVAVNNQGESAIAIGNLAVLAGQGDNAIAIGNRAGGFVNPQAATSIILNATGTQIENTTADSFVVKPVRNASGTHSMEYNPTTGEITYDTLASYTDSNVDTHLNQSNPTSGHVLSWNGSDYAWVAQSGGGGGTFALAGNSGTHTFNTATETLTFLGTTGQINAGIAANNVTLELDPNINSIVSISFEGATADNFETKLQAVDPTADRTINLPDADGTVALLSDISGGGLPSRSPPIGATISLADAAQADLDITGFKSYALLTITTDRAARVRLYVSAATRTADASRAEGVDPTSDAGLIAEVITTGAETVIISPGAIGFNLESSPTTNIPCRVTNKSGGTSTVQVGLNILQLEA